MLDTLINNNNFAFNEKQNLNDNIENKIASSPKKKKLIPVSPRNNIENMKNKKYGKPYILDILHKIVKLYAKEADIIGRNTANGKASIGRERAFSNAAAKFEDYEGEYNYDDLNDSKIGGVPSPRGHDTKSTIQEILEIHQTGTSLRYKDLMQKYGAETFPQTVSQQDKQNVLELFQSIKHIGPSKAQELYNIGYRTLNDLADDTNNLLTAQQKLYLEYHEELEQSIPRDEIDEWKTLLTEVFKCPENLANPKKGQFRWLIAGSYRRGDSESSDIDIVVMNVDSNSILDLLEEYIVAVDKTGSHLSSLLVRLTEDSPVRQMDLIVSTPEAWYYEIFHWTGPTALTLLAQTHARKLGLKLNEKGLWNGTEFIPAESEADIFGNLNVEFIPVEDRIDTLNHLTELK